MNSEKAVLASQPGVLGDTRIYSFPGSNGSNSSQDINKLQLSTSSLALINTLLHEGKLGELIGQISQLVRGHNPVITDTSNQIDQVPLPQQPSSTNIQQKLINNLFSFFIVKSRV